MSKATLFVTMLFWLSAVESHASPQYSAPDKADTPPPALNQELNENMAVSKPPPLPEKLPPPAPHYYAYQQALTFRAGVDGEFPKNSSAHSLLGFEYLFPKFLAPKLEAGADLETAGNGHIHLGSRWIFWQRSFFRPSLSLALDHLMDAAEGFATFAYINNYYVRGGAAAEYTFWDPVSLRLEYQMYFGFKNTLSATSAGLSWAW